MTSARWAFFAFWMLLACDATRAHDPRIDAKISRIEARLESLAQTPGAGPDEQAFRAQLKAIREHYVRYEADGLSDRERKDLSRRLFDLGKSMSGKGAGREPSEAQKTERPS